MEEPERDDNHETQPDNARSAAICAESGGESALAIPELPLHHSDMESNVSFRVGSLDHVELLVPDRYEAAAWYEKVLGLEIVKDYEAWCEPHGGPLMISSDGGQTMVALFRGEAQGETPQAGPRLIAFRTDGEQFLAFIDRCATLDLPAELAIPVTRDDIRNHDKSFSVYLSDPWGNRLEVTTYDLIPVRNAIARPLHKGFDG